MQEMTVMIDNCAEQNTISYLLPAAICFLFLCCGSQPADNSEETNPEFRNIEIVLEYFPDSETVKGHFIVNPGFKLGDLSIENPEKNIILDFYSDDIKIHPNYLEFSTSQAKLSDFRKSFPKGEYKFSSWRAESSLSEKIYKLSFSFTEPPEFIYPPEKHILNNGENLILTWKKSGSSSPYILRIFEDEKLIYYSRLGSSVNEIILQNKYFSINKNYKVRLSAENNNGNLTSSDITFTTTREKSLKKYMINGG